jgi:predicted DNA-binding WGR domain protein
MTRYFTCINDSSNKFWQLDIEATSILITYGKLDTAGQSLTKAFDSAEQCQQAVEKLIREKTRKGYIESGSDVVATATPQPSRSNGTMTAGQEQQKAMLDRYDQIIRNAQTDQLLPFLQSVDKLHYPALRKKIKEAKKYWCDTVTEQGNIRWGTRGTNDQKTIVNLSALAILPFSDAKTFDLYWLLAGEEWPVYTRPILVWARPQWLTEFLTTDNQKNRWHILDYRQLRELENENLITYQPELFAASVVSITTYDHRTRTYSNITDQQNFLASDPVVLNREIPSLFDYPVAAEYSTYIPNPPSGSAEPIFTWSQMFARLLSEGKLDRLWFFEKCLSVQTKDWSASLRLFYRKQIDAATPTVAELLALQTSILPLLAAQHPHVVNWAISLLKAIYTAPDFRVDELLDWASSVMMRSDCKTGLKTLLTIFERFLKTQPDYRTKIACLLADVFALNDLSLQTKAASLLANYGDSTDEDLQSQLQSYSEQMLGQVAETLRPFLTASTVSPDDVNQPVDYTYAPPKQERRLVPDQEIAFPTTWTDLLFLIGKFFSSDDPLDMEILMNTLVLPPTDMPADFRNQLAVYQKKLDKNHFDPGITRLCLGSYLNYWLSDRQDDTTIRYKLNEVIISNKKDFIAVISRRMLHLHQKISINSTLPLLSMPTHAPHWISPTTLLERLVAYQQQNEPIDPLDLAIAIARMPREDTAEAVLLCGQLSGNLKTLMAFCLGTSDDVVLPRISTASSLLSVFKSDNSIAEQQAVWAVAARTFYPDADFPTLMDVSFANTPNVAQPFVPTYAIRMERASWENFFTGRQEYGAPHQQLTVSFPAQQRSLPVLLYSNDLSGNNFSWNFSNLSPVDATYAYSLIPQQPEALFTLIAKHCCATADLGASVTPTLPLMLQPGFQFRHLSLLTLACGLLAKKREQGALAAEVLIHHVGDQTLDVVQLGHQLGYLLANTYAPLQRLIDGLNLVRDVSPRHNKALLLMTDTLFYQWLPYQLRQRTPGSYWRSILICW